MNYLWRTAKSTDRKLSIVTQSSCLPFFNYFFKLWTAIIAISVLVSCYYYSFFLSCIFQYHIVIIGGKLLVAYSSFGCPVQYTYGISFNISNLNDYFDNRRSEFQSHVLKFKLVASLPIFSKLSHSSLSFSVILDGFTNICISESCHPF